MRIASLACAALGAALLAPSVPGQVKAGQAIVTVQVGPSSARKGEMYYVDIATRKVTSLTLPAPLATGVPNCVTMINPVIGYVADQGKAGSGVTPVPSNIYRVTLSGSSVNAVKLNSAAHKGYNLCQIVAVGGTLYYTTADATSMCGTNVCGFYNGFLYSLPASGGTPTVLVDFSKQSIPANHTPNAMASDGKKIWILFWTTGAMYEYDIAGKTTKQVLTRMPNSKRGTGTSPFYPIHAQMKSTTVMAAAGLYGDVVELDMTKSPPAVLNHYYDLTQSGTGLSISKNSMDYNPGAGDYLLGTRDGHVEVLVPVGAGQKAQRYVPKVGTDPTGTNNSVNGIDYRIGNGNYKPYDAGCKGTANFTPTSVSGGPGTRNNATFSFGMGSGLPNKPALLAIGAGKIKVDLTAAGAPGCFLLTAPVLFLPVVTQGTGNGGGSAAIPVPLPNDKVKLSTQWITLDTVNKLGLVFSDARELDT